MIEKVYSGKEPESHVKVKIPKNIRQIGSSNSNKKIYIEDYVMNRLKKKPESENDLQYGILLGQMQNSGGNAYIFIKGMVEVREVLENSIIFNDEIWTGIYQDKKQYFEQLDIVGWYASVPYRVSEDMNGIRKIHLDNFAGNNKVCFISDRSENEEGFYLYEQTSFVKQKGYYIYFEKNEKMKKYVKGVQASETKVKAGSDHQTAGKTAERETKTEASVEERMKEINGIGKGRFAYGISGMLIIALLLSTVVMLNNYGELKNIKKTIAGYQTDREAKAVNEIIDAYEKEQTTENERLTIVSTTIEEQSKETSGKGDENKQKKVEKKVEKRDDLESSFAGTYHTVKKGQTLYDISLKYYGTSEMIDKIKEVNQIDDDYTIIEGEKILLP
ncbi:MAG: LysM peptidoglycan-binding domain-containing protein [Eubacterium sp.]|nr:LysM peptidoglycan-binding domain-containing protein [Eubacterium sp.]